MKKLFFIILLIIPAFCFSQRYLWQRSLGTSDGDKAQQVIKNSNGGYTILALKFEPNYNFNLIFLDSNFNETKKIIHENGYGKHLPWEFVKTLDNGYLIVSTIYDSLGNGKPGLIKLIENGDTVWTKTFSRGENSSVYKIRALSDSGFILPFWSVSNQRNVLKINSKGDTIYSLPIRPADILPLQNSFIAVTSEYFRKYTNSGVLVLDKPLNLQFGVGKIFPIKDGGYLLAGSNQGIGLAKLTQNGDTIWSRRYIENVSVYSQDVQQTADGGFLVLGFGFNFDGNDIVLLKVDKNGNRQWRKILRRDYNDETPANLFLNCDSSIIIIGNATNGQLGNDDIMLLKIDSLSNVAGQCAWESENHKSILKEREIVTYPNPVHEVLNVRMKDPFSGTATITNLLGQVVAHYNFSETSYFSLPFSAYSPGLYILTLTNSANNELNNIKIFKR